MRLQPISSFAIFLFAFSLHAIAQKAEPKTMAASRVAESPKVNGVLDDVCWSTAESATDFIVDRPTPGSKSSQVSDVKVVYDDEALYIGFMCFDTAPDSILNQLTGRDNDGNSDYCGVTFSCYNDGINGFTFAVAPSGEQFDARENTNDGGEDASWNAVWDCKTLINDKGWSAEFRIPWSALRFHKADEQKWGMNFFREVRRIREHSFWNPVDPNQAGFLTQMGTLTGIKNIDPPLRLFFFPYASGYLNLSQDENGNPETSFSYSGGMDVKYGLSDAFTLDATLIPDFGQTVSDALVLNLTPFETRYDENRQFFTEGTELFGKAGLFYSRRIGYVPDNYESPLQPDSMEFISEVPYEVQLINATKISGRTRSGLGIGFFNALSAPTKAIIGRYEDTTYTTYTKHEEDYYPLTNYNIIVFDQNLKNNSSVSLINTSVIRNGSVYDANVTGTEFTIRNKTNSYELGGHAAFNKKFNWNDDASDDGFTHGVAVGKTSGRWNFEGGYNVESDTYDPNDLGFLYNPNEVSYYLWNGYNIREPFGAFNFMHSNFTLYYSNLYKPYTFSNFGGDGEITFVSRKFFAFSINTEFAPVKGYDYFEPRVDGYYFRTPTFINFGGWISSDYRKRIALDLGSWGGIYSGENNRLFNWRIEPRFRVNDHLMLIYVYSRQNHFNDIGFAAYGDDEASAPVFGTRDVISHTNVLTANYAFNPLQSASLRLRHYWGFSSFNKFHSLKTDGNLGETSFDGFNEDGSTVADQSFNSFTIDLVYSWIFLPGSEMSVVWKNSILSFEDEIPASLMEDVQHTFELPQSNSISLKVLYFLDSRSFLKRK